MGSQILPSSGGQTLGGTDNLSFARVETWSEDETRKELDQLFGSTELGFLAVHIERDISPGKQPAPGLRQ